MEKSFACSFMRMDFKGFFFFFFLVVWLEENIGREEGGGSSIEVLLFLSITLHCSF